MQEWGGIIGCLIVFAFYEFYLHWMTTKAPMRSARSAHMTIRSNWVKSVMGRVGTEILVIQTLRNSVMAASFMATTAALAFSATLTFGVGNTNGTLWQALHHPDGSPVFVAEKLLLVATCFFLSFLLMAMAVRFFNHAGYLITGDLGSEEAMRKQSLAVAYVNRAGAYYSLGLRAFFACIPFLVGLLNSLLMIPAALALVVLLYWFDRIPGDQR